MPLVNWSSRRRGRRCRGGRMRAAAAIAWAALALTAVEGRGDWAKLVDGRIGRVIARPEGNWVVEFPGQGRETIVASEIKGILSERNARDEVDAVMRKLEDPANHEAMARLLGHLGPAAVPRLLDYAKRDEPHLRATAMACLQFAWSPEARQAVESALEDEDAQVRRYAQSVFSRHFREAARADALDRMEHNPNAEIAGPALAERLSIAPNVERMREALTTGRLMSDLAPLLPRFHSPHLSAAALDYARDARESERPFLVAGLLHQGAADDATRAWVRAQLRAENSVLRDTAAEYLRWHGTELEREELQSALLKEKDAYTRASIAAALSAVSLRTELFAADDPSAERDLSAVDSIEELIDCLREQRSPSLRAAAWRRFGELEPWTPYHSVLTTVRDPGARLETREGVGWNRRKARAVASFCSWVAAGGDPPRRPDRNPPEPRPAEKFRAPVRDYFDPLRKSFGLYVDADVHADSPFAGSYHAGDDVAWDRPFETVAAIAGGVVRAAETAASTWGGLVVLEHRLEDGARLCSVYGHLGSWLAVQTGDSVSCGQKLGAIGRAYTHENGGYGAHLHFGIRRGGFGPEVMRGYLSPELFDRPDRSGWEDPQAFLLTFLPKETEYKTAQ